MSIIFMKVQRHSIYTTMKSVILCVCFQMDILEISILGKEFMIEKIFHDLLEMKQRPMTACVYEGNRKFSLEHLKLEYPVYGSSDYRYPAVEILQENGSRISEFTYVSYTIVAGNQNFRDFRLLILRKTKKPRPYV